ncbi:MAG: 4Fe-4S binding protein [Bacillota bacterium]
MCEFCTQHGEGKKWYENMENYSRELLHDPKREEYIRNFFDRLERNHMRGERLLRTARRLAPGPYRFLRRMVEPRQKLIHFGQVLPVEDVEAIIDRMGSVTRLTCVCRKLTTGKELRYCLALGADVAPMLDPGSAYRDGLEVLSTDEAKAAVRRFDEEGQVHSVWTMLTPFIGAVCNCDQDCLAYRAQHAFDLATVMFKSEYVARVEPELCAGCGQCVEVCRFGALRDAGGVMAVDARACYGCGLCRARCPSGAVGLVEREWGAQPVLGG